MRRTGYTLADLLVALIVIGILGAAFVVVMLPALGKKGSSPQLKDSTFVRGIHQGMVLLAQNNQDRFPLPSELDMAGHTLPGDPTAKDTTANIISMLIYQGFFSPELTVSPSESNPKIRVFGKYQYGDPSGTVKPRQALWDPAFAADFTAGEANLSYAITPMWSKERVETVTGFNSLQAVVGNRGPQIAGATYNPTGDATPRRMNAGSYTDLIHGGKSTWEGNISYGDNSVKFETTMTPEALKWKDRAGSAFGDVLFYDEPGDTTDTNAFLSIFVNTGATKDQWRAIWD